MKLLLNNNWLALGFIVLVSSALFIPLLGSCPLFDWDEINFAECAREMVVTNNYSSVQLNYNPFWEKPPFFIWLQAISMNIFGINEFAARFPNALCGIITLCVIYLIGKKINSPAFGLTWVLVYAGTLLPHFYFKSGIIDPWFNLFIFLSFYQLLMHFNNPIGKSGFLSALLAGFFLGIAVLTKGPAAIVIVGAFVLVYGVVKKFKNITTLKFVIIFAISLLVTGCSWFVVELLRGNYNIIEAFFKYQLQLLTTEDSGHGGSFLYHVVVLLVGCFPTSLLLLLAIKKSESDTPYQKHIKRGMLFLLGVVLIIFSLLVKTKIVHYSSLCYLPLTYLATYSVFKLINKEYKLKSIFIYSFVAISFIVGMAFTLIGLIEYLKPWILKNNFIDNAFIIGNINAQVHWQGWEWLTGIIFMLLSFYFIWKIRIGKEKFIFYLYGFYVIFICICINTFAPKIELYSQQAPIDFYRAIAKKQFYIETAGFKSYAYLFYGEKRAEQNLNADCVNFVSKTLDSMEKNGYTRITSYSLAYLNWMQFGNIDRPAIFICKAGSENDLLSNKLIKKIYSKNGYVFCCRLPQKEWINNFP